MTDHACTAPPHHPIGSCEVPAETELAGYCIERDGTMVACWEPGTYNLYSVGWSEVHQQTSLGGSTEIVFLPEPSASMLLAVGLVGLVVLGRLR